MFVLIVFYQNYAIIDINLNFIQFYRLLIKIKLFCYKKSTILSIRDFAEQIENNSRIIKFRNIDYPQSILFTTEVSIDQNIYSLDTTELNVEQL